MVSLVRARPAADSLRPARLARPEHRGVRQRVVYQAAGMSVVDDATASGAHEIVESATDPATNSNPAVVGFDPGHLAWELWTEWQDEIADACEFGADTSRRASDHFFADAVGQERRPGVGIHHREPRAPRRQRHRRVVHLVERHHEARATGPRRRLLIACVLHTRSS
jgi:hypothetical protein